MLSQAQPSLIASSLPVILVMAFSTIVTITIVAWVIHKIACKAIEKASPDSVASVLFALGSLLGAMRFFLPWSSLGGTTRSRESLNSLMASVHHNETMPEVPSGEQS